MPIGDINAGVLEGQEQVLELVERVLDFGYGFQNVVCREVPE
jgi:hypothetical protein